MIMQQKFLINFIQTLPHLKYFLNLEENNNSQGNS